MTVVRGFFWLCVFLIIGAIIQQLLAAGSSYLLIVWGQTSIEMNLGFVIICVFITVAIIWLLLSLCRGGLRSIRNASNKLFYYGDRKAQQKTLDGLIDYIEENWSSARRKLMHAATKVETPLINYLAAARSAYEMGDEQAALELLQKAKNCSENSELAVSIVQARMQLNNSQYEQALAALERAAAISPEHPVVLYLRQQVVVALKDWKSLKALLPKLTKNNIGNPASRHQLELCLYRNQFQEAREKHKTLSAPEQKQLLQKLWDELPEYLCNEQWFLSYYASQLMALGDHELAGKVLAKGLRRQWLDPWLDLYGLLILEDSTKPLKTAEKWLRDHQDSPSLLLAIGRLCMRNRQWGRAVDFLQRSLQLQKRPETFAELARALEFTGDRDQSYRRYKEGLLVCGRSLVQLHSGSGHS